MITIGSPTGGWNARDSYAEMPPTDAIELINLVPFGDSIKTRPGHLALSSNLASAVKSLVTYHGATEQLLCVAGGSLIDISAGGAGTAIEVTPATDAFPNSSIVQTCEFKNRIIFCNGSDEVVDYDGTTLTETNVYNAGAELTTNGTFDTDTDWTKGSGWTIAAGVANCDGTQPSTSDLSQDLSLVSGEKYQVTFTISNYSAGTITPKVGTASGTARSANGTYIEVITATGGGSALDVYFTADSTFVADIDDVEVHTASSKTLISATTHHGRVYYIEKDSQSFWYAAAGAYAGVLTEFDLSEFTTTGGDLLYMVSWSRDSGAGMDDMAVFVFDTGELLVYSGSDPGSSSDWAIVGRFRIGKPLGRRSSTRVGGDVIILTVDGYIPLSAALQEGRYTEQSSFSFKIDNAASAAAQAYSDRFGWEAIHWPHASMFIVNVPISTSESVQHVRNTTKGGWCKFTGLNASCWALYNDNMYFGSPDGFVYQVAGSSDNSDFITYKCTQAFNWLGDAGTKKQVTAMEPITNSSYPKYFSLNVFEDFNVEDLDPYDYPPEPVPSDWDVGQWDSAEWATFTSTLNKARKNVVGNGYALAISLRFQSRAQTTVWYATNLWAKPAGVV